MTNDQIMNEIQDNYSTIDGWIFYREYNFDQFKKDEISICVLVEEDDKELNIQVYDADDNEIFSDVIPLTKINTENVLNEVRLAIKKTDDIRKAFLKMKST